MNSKRWIWVLSDLHVRSVLTVLRPVYDSVGTTMDWMRTSPRQSRCVGIRSWGRRESGYRWQRTRSSSSRGPRTSSPRKRSRKVRILEGCIQDYFWLVLLVTKIHMEQVFFHILISPEHKMCSVVLCNYFCLYHPVLDFPTDDLGKWLMDWILFYSVKDNISAIIKVAKMKQYEHFPVYILHVHCSFI